MKSTATDDQPQNIPKDFPNVLNDLQNKISVFMKQEMKLYKQLLRKENTTYYRNTKQTGWNLKQTVLNMTLAFLNLMNHEDVASALENELIGIIQRPLKEVMKNKYHRVCEGIAKQGETTRLNSIYTDLYITEGGSGHVNKEHEVRRIEKNQMQQDVQIKCRTMFERLTEQDRPIRTVLTQGVAGVGKSICVQKFILDWAEGEEHQDIQFIFPLPFQELNLKKGHYSLMEIIGYFFPETKGLILTDQNKVMFILDGLHECKLPLSFSKNEILHNVCKQASVDVVLTNLIKGNLLPSALIWITTRPAAASMIPAECVDRVSEVRGFNDQQKEQYFRKRISDEHLANKIIEHIKQSRSLFIMCHIPVFCWISATVLQNILEETESEETPKTLTNLYTCFLIFQTVQGNLKYTGRNDLDIPWDKEAILALGKLAFQQLEENSLIFCEEDLKACGIDPSKMSAYSGLCTVRFLGTVFSFVHLSIQEFLAAVFAYICVRNEHRNVFEQQSTSQESKTTQLIDFLKIAVDKALESEHGHLDLFLRFLLGLSLESNEKLIRGLLTQTGSSSDCRKEIVEYIKLKFKENPSPERSINLFYCLNELNDDSLVKEIHSYMSSGRLSEAELSPAQWSALVFVLLTSKEKLEEFDLKKFIRSEECLNRLLPVVKEATSALLSECNLTERSCSSLLQVLSSESSELTLLDLSNNPIQDSGVELLSVGLKSSNCKLEQLRLSDCELKEKSCSVLFNVLNSEFTKLTLLDLSNNPIQDCGVEKLSAGLKSPNCKLEKLGINNDDLTEESCSVLATVLTSSSLRELDLSNNNLQNSGVKKLCEALKNPLCKLETLRINNDDLTEESCSALATVLTSSSLIELNLSNNNLQDSGVKKLCEALKNPFCKLETLSLSSCSVTEEGYSALTSTLKENPKSHLKKLDFSGNDPGDKGVELITSVFMNSNKTLRLLKSDAAEKAFSRLLHILKKNPLLQRELDLSKMKPEQISVNQLSALLEDTHCRLQKLTLYKGGRITGKDCADVISALIINPSHLRGLNLNENKLDHSALLKLCDLLKNPRCKLEKLRLKNCSIEEKGCADLASALCLNPTHIKVLDLSKNKLGDSGMKQLCELLKNHECKLQELLLKECSIGEEGCADLTLALTFNTSHLRELDLQGNKLGKSVKQLSELMKKSGCNLRLDKSLLGSIAGWFTGNLDKGGRKDHKQNQEETEEEKEHLDNQNNDQCTEEEDKLSQVD